jgi:hypothetical protein
VGVRMIQNFSATDASLTWPQVESNDYLEGRVPAFGANLRLLAALGLVFDFHANPLQLGAAATLFAGLGPRLPAVVINHLGCPKLGSGDAAADAATTAAWRAGIAALAALGPRVCIKISGLEYIYGGWLEKGSRAREVVKDLVFFVLDTFGPGRCMVASNFPVDLAMGGKVRAGWGGWRGWTCTRRLLPLPCTPLSRTHISATQHALTHACTQHQMGGGRTLRRCTAACTTSWQSTSLQRPLTRATCASSSMTLPCACMAWRACAQASLRARRQPVARRWTWACSSTAPSRGARAGTHAKTGNE